MHREGHIGGALLAYAPVGTTLAMSGREEFALVGAAVMVSLAMVPDWDVRVPGMKHRGVTHTFLFALLMGGVLFGAGVVLAQTLAPAEQATVAAYGFFLGALSVIVHIAIDALTPAGVRPFWPLWRKQFSLSVTRAGNPVANHMLLLLGVLASSVSLLVLMG